MCGFAGVFGFNPKKEQINKCLEGLKRRGPDDYGYYLSHNLSLVHTRLSIIDLTDDAKQPMVHNQTGVTIVFNGEIYNYRDLRKQHNLNSKIKSDTRIILELYVKFGLDFVSQLNGMFAICIWDPREQTIHLIRDRFGIKPIYIYQQREKFIFGSDLNSLFDLGAKKEPNLKSIKNYLNYGITENNRETFYNNIIPIQTGSTLSITSDKIIKKKYWDLDKIDKDYLNLNENELLEFVEYNIDKSINSHLISDLPIGLTLSSGLDSNILLNYMFENDKTSKIKTFTYGYDENIYDESKKIQKFYNNEKIESHISKLESKNLINELSEAVNYFNSPLGGLGTLSLFNLMKNIKKNDISVILSGEGADEVFAGYKYYFYAMLLDLKKNNDHKRLNDEIKSWHLITGEDLSNIVKNDKLIANKAFGMMAPDGTSLKSENFEGDLLKNLNTQNELYSHDFNYNNLNRVRYEDIFKKKLPKLLMFQDRCSMFSSIETRVPFLDHNLVENIFKLNPSNLIRKGKLKRLLRNDMKKFKFKDIKNSQKEYVATPQREWLKKDLYNDIYDEIKSSKLQDLGIVNLKAFLNEYESYSSKRDLGNSFFVWKVLNLKYIFN
tara:strand:+ start:1023 stop:2846 length:1824 start_codon:yes stop_codon:yes gene_type:complete